MFVVAVMLETVLFAFPCLDRYETGQASKHRARSMQLVVSSRPELGSQGFCCLSNARGPKIEHTALRAWGKGMGLFRYPEKYTPSMCLTAAHSALKVWDCRCITGNWLAHGRVRASIRHQTR